MDSDLILVEPDGILLGHKKEHIWVSSNEVDESRAYYKVKLVRKQKIYIVY